MYLLYIVYYQTTQKKLKKVQKSVDIFGKESIILSCSPERTADNTTENKSLKNGFEKKI